MAGTVSGAIKGWITRKVREKDPNLNFEIVTGWVVAEDITDVEDFLTEQMVEDYGIDKEYLKDKRIYYEDGEWKADQSVQEPLCLVLQLPQPEPLLQEQPVQFLV